MIDLALFYLFVFFYFIIIKEFISSVKLIFKWETEDDIKENFLPCKENIHFYRSSRNADRPDRLINIQHAKIKVNKLSRQEHDSHVSQVLARESTFSIPVHPLTYKHKY